MYVQRMVLKTRSAKHRVDTKLRNTKIGQLCELDLGHVSNQIGQQKMSNRTLSAKFRNLYLRNFAEFREININFILISYFTKLKKIEFRIHPSQTSHCTTKPGANLSGNSRRFSWVGRMGRKGFADSWVFVCWPGFPDPGSLLIPRDL
jgi:hypothetical protein